MTLQDLYHFAKKGRLDKRLKRKLMSEEYAQYQKILANGEPRRRAEFIKHRRRFDKARVKDERQAVVRFITARFFADWDFAVAQVRAVCIVKSIDRTETPFRPGKLYRKYISVVVDQEERDALGLSIYTPLFEDTEWRDSPEPYDWWLQDHAQVL